MGKVEELQAEIRKKLKKAGGKAFEVEEDFKQHMRFFDSFKGAYKEAILISKYYRFLRKIQCIVEKKGGNK